MTSKRLSITFSKYNQSSYSCKPSVLWSGNVVFAKKLGGQSKGAIAVNDQGLIEKCLPGTSLEDARQWAGKASYSFVDLGEKSALSPGLIDVHTHISELGRNWEGYETATLAAAAGGVTTLMGMPLNSLPATTSPKSVQLEREAAMKTPLYADVGLWGGAVPSNANSTDINALLDSGVFGLKAFLAPLPAAAGFQTVSPEQLSEVATICGQRRIPILVHSELMTQDDLDKSNEDAFRGRSLASYQAHLRSRPPEWEREAVKIVCDLSDRCPMHVVHLSDAGCLTHIAEAKTNGRSLTVETCPHYLLFDSSSIADGETRLKCFPPIRDRANRNALWERGLSTGLIDMVASDHSPCSPELRHQESGNFKTAWGGLSGVQYQLPATFKEYKERGFSSLSALASWWSENPSRFVPALASVKGSIDEGKHADLVWWDPEYEGFPNEYSKEYHRWTGSFFGEISLRGRVMGTWLRGTKVYDGATDTHLVPVGSLMECT